MSVRFSITPAAAAADKNLPDSVFRTLACLGIFGDRNGWCWPGLGTLAEMRGVSKSRISQDIKILVKRGYLEKQPRYDENGQKSNRYRLLFDTPVDTPPLTPEVNPPLTPEVNPPLTPEVNQNAPINAPKIDKMADAKFSEIARYLESKGIILKSVDADLIATWLEKHEPARIKQAIDIAAAKGARSTAYVDKIPIGWEANGYPRSREEQVKERKGEKSNGNNKSSKPAIQQESPTAGDLEAARLVIERKRARGEL